MLEKQEIRRSRKGFRGSVGAPPVEGAQVTIKDVGQDAGRPVAGRARTRAAAPGVAGRRYPGPGLDIARYFTAAGDDGFGLVEWEQRTATISGCGVRLVRLSRESFFSASIMAAGSPAVRTA